VRRSAPTSSALERVALAGIATYAVLTFVALLDGPDVLGDAGSIMLGVSFGLLAAGRHRDAVDETGRRNARILGGCAGVIILSGVVKVLS